MPRAPKPPPKPKRRPPNSGSVTVRKDGRIVVVLPKELDPKRKAVYGPGARVPFASAAQAALWLDAELVRRRSPTPIASATETLGHYLARWYGDHLHEWPERTALAYDLSLRRWRILGHAPIGTLTRDVVQGGLRQLHEQTWQRTKKDGTRTGEPKPYSRRTIAHARAVLHQALEDLVPDVLTYNPAKARRRGRPQPAPEQPVWSAEQSDHFLAVAERTEPRIALAFRLILRRALRVGEAVDMTILDVDERAMTLRVDETPGLKRGTSGPTKTRRVRDVPLSADLARRLREHRHAYPATDPHLFTLDGERISLQYFRQLWHRTVRVAQLPRITPKDGRATCATLLLDQGWPLPAVAQLLGHTSIQTTAQFYARVVKRRADQTAQLGERIDAALDAASAEGRPTPLRGDSQAEHVSKRVSGVDDQREDATIL